MLVGHLPELILVLVLALIFVGPGKLPELGGALGKGLRSFQRASTDLSDAIEAEPVEAPPAKKLSTPAARPAQPGVEAEPGERVAGG